MHARTNSSLTLNDTSLPKKSTEVRSCRWRWLWEMSLWSLSFPLVARETSLTLEMALWSSSAVLLIWIRSLYSCKNAIPFQLVKSDGLQFLIKDACSVQERNAAVTSIALLRSSFKNSRLKKNHPKTAPTTTTNCYDTQNSISNWLEMWLSIKVGKISFSATAACPWEGTVASPEVYVTWLYFIEK